MLVERLTEWSRTHGPDLLTGWYRFRRGSLRPLAENWSSPDTPAFEAIPARRALSTAMPWRLILRTAVNWHGEKEGEPLAYVGESEDIGSHIKSHDAAKDWGSMAVLVTTAGNKLNSRP